MEHLEYCNGCHAVTEWVDSDTLMSFCRDNCSDYYELGMPLDAKKNQHGSSHNKSRYGKKYFIAKQTEILFLFLLKGGPDDPIAIEQFLRKEDTLLKKYLPHVPRAKYDAFMREVKHLMHSKLHIKQNLRAKISHLVDQLSLDDYIVASDQDQQQQQQQS